MSSTVSPYVGLESALVALTGNDLVDAFLGGSKWGRGAAGTAASVTYGFPTSTAAYDRSDAFGFYGDINFSDNIASADFAPFGTSEQTAAREVLQTWANVANITFVEVQANSTTAATLRFDYTGSPGLTYGTYAVSWIPMDIPAAGDTWINAEFFFPDGWGAGSLNRLTLLHETGHALGLKHPHDTGMAGYFDGWPDTTATLPFIGDTLLDYSTSDAVMAYNDYPGIGSPVQADYAPTSPMRLDIAAIQYLYGANTAFNAGDTTYTYSADGHYHETIWDGGGNDTIVASGSGNAFITLIPGDWSQLGQPITYSQRSDTDLTVVAALPELTNAKTVSIYDTVTIENAQGGSGDDGIVGNMVANHLMGNAGNDLFAGGGGNDILDGGTGIDMALFIGNHSAYTFIPMNGGVSVRDSVGSEGTDSLSNIERLVFADEKIALDLDGNAGMTAKLLGVVFGAASVANKTYVGIVLGLLDDGMGYADLAGLAVQAVGASAPEQVINLLWSNLAGSIPSVAQAQPLVDLLSSGGITVGALTVLAADTSLNQANINLTGLAQTGLEYV